MRAEQGGLEKERVSRGSRGGGQCWGVFLLEGVAGFPVLPPGLGH